MGECGACTLSEGRGDLPWRQMLDYASIDIEGKEGDVLKCFPFNGELPTYRIRANDQLLGACL